MEERIIIRRDFLRVAVGTAMAATLGGRGPGRGQSRANRKSCAHPEC